MSTQRILVDFATRKNASALKGLREGLADPEHSPVAILTELAVEATANFTEAQRILLNLAQQENEIVMSGVKERIGGSALAATLADRVQHGVDTFVEMQQEFLTIASKHAQKRFQGTKDGKGMDLNCLIDASRESMDAFVDAQKKFLDILVEGKVKGKAKPEEGSKRRVAISHLARNAADAFVDAQKKLLDLAGQQVNVDIEAASQVADMAKSMGPVSMPNFTGEGVKRFVDAEKAILDSMMQPANGHKQAAKAERVAKRPARRKVATRAAAEATV